MNSQHNLSKLISKRYIWVTKERNKTIISMNPIQSKITQNFHQSLYFVSEWQKRRSQKKTHRLSIEKEKKVTFAHRLKSFQNSNQIRRVMKYRQNRKELLDLIYEKKATDYSISRHITKMISLMSEKSKFRRKRHREKREKSRRKSFRLRSLQIKKNEPEESRNIRAMRVTGIKKKLMEITNHRSRRARSSKKPPENENKPENNTKQNEKEAVNITKTKFVNLSFEDPVKRPKSLSKKLKKLKKTFSKDFLEKIIAKIQKSGKSCSLQSIQREELEFEKSNKAIPLSKTLCSKNADQKNSFMNKSAQNKQILSDFIRNHNMYYKNKTHILKSMQKIENLLKSIIKQNLHLFRESSRRLTELM